jgi:hypothetical protein
MVLPARVSLFGAVLLVPLSALLIFGSGPIPGYGIAGAGYAFVLYYVGATVVLASYLISGRSPVTLRFRGVRLKGGHFADIFSVGAVSALMTVQANIIVPSASAPDFRQVSQTTVTTFSAGDIKSSLLCLFSGYGEQNLLGCENFEVP